MATKRKTLTYKIAQFEPENALTLQKALQQAFRKYPIAMNRKEALSIGGDTYRLVLHRQTHRGLLCGVFSGYTLGADVPTIELDPKSENLSIASVAPSASDPTGRKQFIAGLLYFGVLDNHVVISQSLRQRSTAFESHINWLLRHAGLFADDSPASIYLSDQVPPKHLAKINHVKNVTLKAPLDVDYAGGVPTPRPVGRVWHSLRDFLGTGTSIPKSFRFEDAVQRGQIKAEMKLSWTGRPPDDGTPLLDEVATVLRHDNDVDYVIHLEGGVTLTKKDIRLAEPFDVEHVSSEEAELGDMFDHMVAWLQALGERERVIL
jgi:hypothetical protein